MAHVQAGLRESTFRSYFQQTELTFPLQNATGYKQSRLLKYAAPNSFAICLQLLRLLQARSNNRALFSYHTESTHQLELESGHLTISEKSFSKHKGGTDPERSLTVSLLTKHLFCEDTHHLSLQQHDVFLSFGDTDYHELQIQNTQTASSYKHIIILDRQRAGSHYKRTQTQKCMQFESKFQLFSKQ